MLARVMLLWAVLLVVCGGIALAEEGSARLEPEFAVGPMRVQTLSGFTYLYESKEITHDQIPATIGELVGNVMAALKEANVQTLGGEIAIYKQATEAGKPFTLEGGFSVPAESKAVGDLKVRKVEPFRGATMIYSGSIGRLWDGIQKLQQEMARAGLKSNGEYREYYLYWEDVNSPNNVMLLAFGIEETPQQAVAPRIEEKGGFLVAGLRYEGENKEGEIPKLWDEMLERMAKLERIRTEDRAAYGVARALPGVEPGPFEYLAAVAVKSIDDLPEGMVGWSLSAHTYAVVPAKGVPDLSRASGWFFGEWLPKSDYESADNYMFEQYTEEFEKTQTIYLWFPVRGKE